VRRAPEAYRLRAIVLNQPAAPRENMVIVDVPARPEPVGKCPNGRP
jgi:hypothetical protein